MKKKYIYKNAVIYVNISNINMNGVRTATENFLRKVIKEKEERNRNGNYGQGRVIRKKSVLDK